MLPEAFALCREARKRTLGQRHYDVQLIGGMVLHAGSIAEMKTGEGKTLTATLAVFLNTLGGDSVHIVTVNDYLARRDAEWMQPSTSRSASASPRSRTDDDHATAAANVRLRHHLRHQLRVRLRLPARQHGRRARALRPARPRFAIVDEVDNILIDEARTPLIISGAPEQAARPLLHVRPPGQADWRASRRSRS